MGLTETKEMDLARGMELAETIRDLDGLFGRMTIEITADSKILLIRILEEAALAGLKVQSVIEEVIKINKDGGGEISVLQRENPADLSFKGFKNNPWAFLKGLISGPDTLVAKAGAEFETSKSKAVNPSSVPGESKSNISADVARIMEIQIEESEATLLGFVQQFREMIENTLGLLKLKHSLEIPPTEMA
jgi:hypothetical protein